MDLGDLIDREPNPEPWAEGDNIPWNEPDFSTRMLKEHLSQEHDAASRRLEIIDKQIEWIHRSLLMEKPNRVLDLCCGPGLYTSRLAELGHACVGIDYSPASIAYAKDQVIEERTPCQYHEADVREVNFGDSFDLIMLISGEFNVFRRDDAASILSRAHDSLADSGTLLLELHPYERVQEIGSEGSSWYSAESGLFSDRPHVCLKETFWNEALRTATTRYHIVDASSGSVTAYALSMQAYTNEEYRTLLVQCGFKDVRFRPSMTAQPEGAQSGFFVMLARKEKRA